MSLLQLGLSDTIFHVSTFAETRQRPGDAIEHYRPERESCSWVRDPPSDHGSERSRGTAMLAGPRIPSASRLWRTGGAPGDGCALWLRRRLGLSDVLGLVELASP